MSRRFPLFATLVVLAAVAVMLRLGFWQLERKAEKEALIARYVAAQADQAVLPLGAMPPDDALLFRRAMVPCGKVTAWLKMAGVNAGGESGIAHVATCATGDIVLGWSRDLHTVDWAGGTVIGVLAPGSGGKVRLIADPPLAGLQASARPDPRDIPNNHLSYAVQWFLFAGVALVIYALALWKRLRERR